MSELPSAGRWTEGRICLSNVINHALEDLNGDRVKIEIKKRCSESSLAQITENESEHWDRGHLY